jgi:iron-sulfur cluster repair protein YtfE (RIC family)
MSEEASEFEKEIAIEAVVPSSDESPERSSDSAANPTRADRGPDVAAIISAEHEALRAKLTTIVNQRWASRRRHLFRLVAQDIVRHDSAEEMVLHPLLRQIEGGEALHNRVLAEEQALSVSLVHLLRRLIFRPRGRGTRRQIARFAEDLERHMQYEELAVLPIVGAVEVDAQRHVLGTWIQYVERFGPTRPHPHLPRGLAGMLVFGPAAAITDRLRDLLLDSSTHRLDPPRARHR